MWNAPGPGRCAPSAHLVLEQAMPKTPKTVLTVHSSRYPALDDLSRLALRRYPSFIYTGELDDYLPVFTFHTLEPGDFEGKLEFLATNGYRALSLDEAVRYLRGEGDKPSRAVVLTIDDGRLSTWTVGYGLLRKYGMCATAYVIPGYLEEGPVRPRLDDASGGRTDELDSSEAVDKSTVMRWSEVELLHESGVVQIESHTMLHRRVPVSKRLLGFLGPDPAGPYYDYPKDPSDRTPWTRAALRDNVGFPLFDNLPVLAATTSWQGFRAVADLCRAATERAANGSAGSPGFERWLRKELRRERPWPDGSVSLEGEQAWELSEAKRTMEGRLRGKTVRHFCYPHSLGTARSLRLALEAGYSTTAWGVLSGRRTNRRGSGGEVIERLKHDYVYRLPGVGRKSLGAIIGGKSLRRFRGERGF